MTLLDRTRFNSVLWDTYPAHWGVLIKSNTGLSSVSGNPPSPFDQWFPATSVDFPAFSIGTSSFNVSDMKSRNIPTGSSNISDLSISFIDAYPGVLFNWFNQWIEKDCKRNGLIRPIKSSGVLKNVSVVRFTRDGEILREWLFECHPVGTFNFKASSDESVTSFTVKFNIWKAMASEQLI